jgi:peptide/nickel transport system ATP-binding protein
MYAGKVVERGTVGEVLDTPLHPYTRGLIGSVPSRNCRGRPLAQIPGSVPSPLQLPAGCAFRTRCPRADALCNNEPDLTISTENHLVRCFHPHRETV